MAKSKQNSMDFAGMELECADLTATGDVVVTGGLTYGGVAQSATSAEVDRMADTSARIVTSTASVLALTVTAHAERTVLVNSNTTFANTFTLPAATGSGAKFTIINNVVQTQGTVVVAAANTADVMAGICIAIDSTAATNASPFLTTATSDKVTLNLTTTGGLGQDKVECWDIAANTWRVEVLIHGSGSLGTPFAAT